MVLEFHMESRVTCGIARAMLCVFLLAALHLSIMPLPVDLSLYIPVVCMQEDAPKYNGKCFMEVIDKIQKLNGQSIYSDCRLTKADSQPMTRLKSDL